jgi:hypothetical protein
MHPSPEPTSSFRLYAALIRIKSVRHIAERRLVTLLNPLRNWSKRSGREGRA